MLQPSVQWGWSEILANKTNYLLELLVWAKSKDASKKRPMHRPKPFIPDFMKQPLPPSPINDGAEAQSVDDVKSWLNTPRG